MRCLCNNAASRDGILRQKASSTWIELSTHPTYTTIGTVDIQNGRSWQAILHKRLFQIEDYPGDDLTIQNIEKVGAISYPLPGQRRAEDSR